MSEENNSNSTEEEIELIEDYLLDNEEEVDGLAEILGSSLDQHATLKEIFDSMAKSTKKGNAARNNLGYLIKLSEQLTGNANSIGNLLKARGSLKKDVVDQRIKVKKAAIDEDQGNKALEMNSEIIRLIQNSLNTNVYNIDIRNEDSIPEDAKTALESIDNQIENQLNSSEEEVEIEEDEEVLEENVNKIISDTDGYLYIYNIETGEIETLVEDDDNDNFIPVKADKVYYNEDTEEFVALYKDTEYEVYEIE